MTICYKETTAVCLNGVHDAGCNEKVKACWWIGEIISAKICDDGIAVWTIDPVNAIDLPGRKKIWIIHHRYKRISGAAKECDISDSANPNFRDQLWQTRGKGHIPAGFRVDAQDSTGHRIRYKKIGRRANRTTKAAGQS